jgi:drug/metabolite transporter (DMT)-like permease
LVASVALIITGFAICPEKRKFTFPHTENRVRFWLAAAAKGINTYSWILAVTLISAASAATLEGLHIVFTVAILFLILKGKAPSGRSWVTYAIASVLLFVGALLILDLPASVPNGAVMGGIVLGLISGLSFSIFYVTWDRTSQHPYKLWQRATEVGGLLLASLLCQFPVHFLVNAFWFKGNLVPFTGMSVSDVGVQLICGLIGIGATYLLINESLHLMQNDRWCSLLLGIGLSYSVPFTMILESYFLGLPVVFNQWMGTLVFTVAFAAIYQDIQDTKIQKLSKNA